MPWISWRWTLITALLQREVAHVVRDKSGYAFHHRLLRLIMMPFGLKRTVDVYMRNRHHTILGEVAVCPRLSRWYRQVFKASRWAYRRHTTNRRVIEKHCVTLNLKAWDFFSNIINYIGHIIKQGGLEVTSHTIGAICSSQTPSNSSEFPFFLCLSKVFFRLYRNLHGLQPISIVNCKKSSPLCTGIIRMGVWRARNNKAKDQFTAIKSSSAATGQIYSRHIRFWSTNRVCNLSQATTWTQQTDRL